MQKLAFQSAGRRAFGAKVAHTIVPCSTPSLYTIPALDATFDLTKFDKGASKLFSSPCVYVSPADFNYKPPSSGLPEFAFIGRSNVGKSSLIDSLLSTKGLVRISKEPGCTKTVNYFAYHKRGSKTNHIMYCVDLPGYGFARASKTDQQNWIKTTEGYFKSRNFTILRRVYVLVDCRHGIKPVDREIMDLLNESRITYQVILTKADLCTHAMVLSSLQSVLSELIDSRHRHHSIPIVHVVSSRTGYGIQAVKQCITEMMLSGIEGGHAEGRQGSDKNVFEHFDEETIMKSLRNLGIDTE